MSRRLERDNETMRMSYLPKLKDYEKRRDTREDNENDDDYDDNDDDDDYDDRGPEMGPEGETEPWDVFRYFPPKLKTGSKADTGFFDNLLRLVKLVVYAFLFSIVFFGGIIAGATIVFAASQIENSGPVPYCDYNEPEQAPMAAGRYISASVSKESTIVWYWCVAASFAVPEVLSLLEAIHNWFFKKQVLPKLWDLTFFLAIETINVIGLALLFVLIVPQLNSVEALVACTCTCLVPGLLAVLSRNKRLDRGPRKRRYLVAIGDAAALAGQLCGALIWLLPDANANSERMSRWLLPLALTLVSSRWWANYVSPDASCRFSAGLVRFLSRIKDRLEISGGAAVTQASTAVCRIIVFFAVTACIGYTRDAAAAGDIGSLRPAQWFLDGAGTIVNGRHNVTLVETSIGAGEEAVAVARIYVFTVDSYRAPLIAFVVHAAASLVVYSSGKFACKTLMQVFGFAIPASLCLPGTVAVLVLACLLRARDLCVFHGFLPDYIFFRAPPDIASPKDFLWHLYPWIWLVTLSSQAWITRHLWSPLVERMAPTERIFLHPTYDSLHVVQSMMLNRRRDEEFVQDGEPATLAAAAAAAATSLEHGEPFDPVPATEEDGKDEKKGKQEEEEDEAAAADRVTKIFACATMWHETEEEMNEFVESILRFDWEQSPKHFVQGYYDLRVESYCELETHVFFDDAFRCMHGCQGRCNHDEDETSVNDYVMSLIETVRKSVEGLNMRARPPIKFPAPYGGRLQWTLPGGTPLVVHLKDKNKIRHRKRWSQVMYMYYLLGYRLMDRPISCERKQTIAENTYLLTLDGDIDFRPSAVRVLVDLMKRDRDLGAACGRIHPIGSGPMVWFQKFEYAIGHWLQKSTEHTIGSVLCSPGCFSLFRAKALMEHNVMRKYAIRSTEPRHYVQYDQGEDRWLCTLILQVGYRVEYSAASDSYTHAPETFSEFYNQRRRWIPSTIANIFDLLSTSEETRKVNDDISWLYIVYQWVLMGSTVLGPGTIFLMLVGAFVAAFRIDNWSSFAYNLIPIGIFVAVCFACKARIQLIVAGIITAFYGLVMIVVLVGIMLQIADDGWVAPSTILFFVVAGQLVVAGLLHPQEWSCLLCGLVYYVTVPSMYMLLIIFSLFNVNNVTWGTRDSGAPPANNDTRLGTAGAQNERANAPGAGSDENGRSGGLKPRESATVEFSLAGLFKCMLCTHKETPPPLDDVNRFEAISVTLDRIDSRLNAMEKFTGGTHDSADSRQRNAVTVVAVPSDRDGNNEIDSDDPGKECDSYDDDDDEKDDGGDDDDDDNNENEPSRRLANFLVSPYWLQDERLRKGGVEFLSREEEHFWERLIDKYLHPIDEDKKQLAKTAQGLKDLRDEYLLKFFMLNSLFVLIVFLMQLNKDVLHLQWPLGATYNITYVQDTTEVHLVKNYLKLEPIGCLFIIGFVVILAVQFIAMLFHRFDTLAHMLANTDIRVRRKKSKPVELSEPGMLEKHAEDIADELQRVAERHAASVFGRANTKGTTLLPPGRRKTVIELVESQGRNAKLPTTLDALFRMNMIESRSEISRFVSTRMPRDVFEALERRHSTVVADRRRAQKQRRGSECSYRTTTRLYDSPRGGVPSLGPFGPEASSSRHNIVCDNRAFEPDSYNDEYSNGGGGVYGTNDGPIDASTTPISVPHRSSQVTFGLNQLDDSSALYRPRIQRTANTTTDHL